MLTSDDIDVLCRAVVEVNFVNRLESSFATTLETLGKLDLGNAAAAEVTNVTGGASGASSGVGASLGESGRSRLAGDNRKSLGDSGSLSAPASRRDGNALIANDWAINEGLEGDQP